jgi:5'-methylthioadenosine phosphorylase
MTMLGVIGGSGLYDLPDLQDAREVSIETPWGLPASPIIQGRLGDTDIAFLARHGRGHRFTPTEVPYRANIHALRSIGVTHVLSVSAVGSLRSEHAPGSAVIPDQLIDRTTLPRPRTFFEDGIVAHVGLADPFCTEFRDVLFDISKPIVGDVSNGGTYVVVEGPQFSTRAESELHRSWGASIVGMTAMPEARLAREAGLCYAMLAMVTDYDVWHESEDDVSVDVVIQVLHRNVEHGRNVVRELARRGLPECNARCSHAIQGAVITAPEAISDAAKARVALLLEPRE